jgi:predicted nucleic acid-binding protein
MGMIDFESFTGDHVYLDANVFIYAVEGFEKYAWICKAILKSVEDMKIHAVTSELTLAEVLVGPFKAKNPELAKLYDELLSDQDDLTMARVSRPILVKAAELRASLGLKPPDAIHVATALVHNSEFFFTADRSLRAPASLKIVSLDELLSS